MHTCVSSTHPGCVKMGQNNSLPMKLEDLGQALLDKEIPLENFDFYDQIFQMPMTIDEINVFLDFDFLSALKEQQPQNLSAIFQHALAKLKGAAYSGHAGPDQISPLVNCVLILTRCIAAAVKDPSDAFYAEYIWNRRLNIHIQLGPSSKDGEGAGGDQSTDDDGEEVDEDAQVGAEISDLPIAQQIVLVLSRLLFLPGFTVAEGADAEVGRLRANYDEMPVACASGISICGGGERGGVWMRVCVCTSFIVF